VLSSDDPVRVYQRYATLDGLSRGRAQVILGRDSSIESFPLFGHDTADYEVLFEEKLDLFARLLEGPRVTWSGTTRPALHDQLVVPRLEHSRLDTWVGIGGSPDSVRRAARHGLPLMITIIGGPAERFAPFAELHRRELHRLGLPPQSVGVHSPGYVADTDAQALEEFWPHYLDRLARVGRERGFRPPTPESFAREVSHGALYVGSPERVAHRIVATLRTMGAARFDLKYGMGDIPDDRLMRSIELYGRQVAPRVLELMGDAAAVGSSVR
jgi:alkanesulfonate monooxygenase SsuD/methylene tetrahydromethanopterin reductase-like flavin-dependent oxidoreductase (luciferase family)